MSADVDMKQAIEDFQLLVKENSSTLYLECLIQSFEKSYVQRERVSKMRFWKTLSHTSLFKHVPYVAPERDTIYFWPFQFHHCDFLVPVIKQLQKEDARVRVLITRPNMKPHLKSLGVDGILIDVEQKLRSPSSWFNRFKAGLHFYKSVKGHKQSNHWKKSAFAAFETISLAEKTRFVAQQVAKPGSGQYHMVGHDLTPQGKTIVNAVKEAGLTTARVQNGAVNYLLCQYSIIDEVFFWDDLSKRAYEQNSWKGSAHIIGNQKLWQKQKNGVSHGWQTWLNQYHTFSKKVAVAFSGPGHKTSVQGHTESLRYLLELVKALPEVGFIIKLHPKDKLEYYQDLANHQNVLITANLEQEQQPDALDALMTSDFLITGGSTVALDAMALNIPVISIDPLGEMEQFEFLKESGVTKWKRFEELDTIAELATNLPIADKDIRHLPQNPAERIANILQKRA